MAAMPAKFFSSPSIFSETFVQARPYASMLAPWLAFFLATPGDLAGPHENAARLSISARSATVFEAEKPTIVNVVGIHF